MTTKRDQRPEPPEKQGTPVAKQTKHAGDAYGTSRALPMKTPAPDSRAVAIGQGRIDVTGIVPEGIHIDPDITEGHPGYEESGDSEIIPPERLAGGSAKP